MKRFQRSLRPLWSYRRWLYAGYMLIAIARIPARVGFQVVALACDTRMTIANAALSLTKVPHMVLFGIFFLLTVVQFTRIDRKAIAWSVIATGALGVLVELEEGATRTGNCRLTDVLPDLFGALVAAALVTATLWIIRERREMHRAV